MPPGSRVSFGIGLRLGVEHSYLPRVWAGLGLGLGPALGLGSVDGGRMSRYDEVEIRIGFGIQVGVRVGGRINR